MKIYEFTQIFPIEYSFKVDFKAFREQEGLVCEKCLKQKALLASIKMAVAMFWILFPNHYEV